MAARPFAAGDDLANIAHDRSGTWALQRWVARRSGVLRRLYFYVKVEGSDRCPYGGRSGYAGGSSGRLLATTHPVLANGRPNMRRVLARRVFRPCGNDNGETVWLPHNRRVKKGREYATVVRNVAANPRRDYFSTNYLFHRSGVLGANGRNVRSPRGKNAYHGLDPREVVGYSTNGGRTWRLPGGPYGGRNGAAFLPTYLQEYATGPALGQPYSWSRDAIGTVTMVFPRVRRPWKITHLGAYVSHRSAGVVTLKVNGRTKRRAKLSGGPIITRKIRTLRVRKGQTVSVTTTAGDGGLAIRRMGVDRFWANKARLGRGHRHYLKGDPIFAASFYPLPAN